jgi:hypothetical protein
MQFLIGLVCEMAFFQNCWKMLSLNIYYILCRLQFLRPAAIHNGPTHYIFYIGPDILAEKIIYSFFITILFLYYLEYTK